MKNERKRSSGQMSGGMIAGLILLVCIVIAALILFGSGFGRKDGKEETVQAESTAAETAPETEQETAPETEQEAASEMERETVPETAKETVPETAAVRLGWYQEGDKWYYYESGVPKTGWLEEGEKKYFLLDDGTMKTGFLKMKAHEKQSDGTYSTAYGNYFLDDGSMYTGKVMVWWQGENGDPEVSRRYARERGVLYVNRDSEEGQKLQETVEAIFGTEYYSAMAEVGFDFHSDGTYDIYREASE